MEEAVLVESKDAEPSASLGNRTAGRGEKYVGRWRYEQSVAAKSRGFGITERWGNDGTG